ncbi:bacterioferritin [Pseudoxanthomonas kalamensis DSM 18571]|uniref:(2Fe-2S)-binding protein n=1 Tax=Pseudoxanthomonas kalamensis TaxID=289483 RepID=UPI0013916AE9|nr:(2Fe-2S)-binding protein [Pseudoxanthomonas kalamensis]KAF1712610.1 bacterioferritin [Pseudoxanthomonas kalamensis DSM 18571]
MYVCVCNGVTDRQIREAAAGGCRSVAELTMRTGAGACCGTCLDLAASLLDEVAGARDLGLPLLNLSQAA